MSLILNVQISNIVAAAQAITRGLGWHSSLKIHKTEQNATYIAPDEVKLNGKLQYFAPITAFDSLIQSEKHRRLSDLGSQISTSSFYTGTEKLNVASREISQMLGKDDKLYIHWHLADPVKLISRIESFRYSFYLDEKLADRPDFLMATSLTEGISLQSIMKKQELHSIYGIYTLRILEGIGFSTVLSPLYPEIKISGTFRTRDYNPGIAVERNNYKFLTYPTIKRDYIPRGSN